MSEATCPCCGTAFPDGVVPVDKLPDQFPPRMGAILRELANGTRIPTWDIVIAVYGRRPSARDADAALKVTISRHREKLALAGWQIDCIRGAGYRLVRAAR